MGPREVTSQAPDTSVGVRLSPPEASEAHLGFIQDTIARMANNSFLLKGWTVSVTAGILAFVATGPNPLFAWIGLFPTTAFWLLDAYYLKQERLYRKLYDDVRAGRARNFAMSAKHLDGDDETRLWATFRASTVFWLHFSNAVVVSAVPVVLL